MFRRTYAFNQNLSNWERAGSSLSKVNSFENMFDNATAFNNGSAATIANQLPWTINTTDASVNMASMFVGATAFNSNLGTGTTPWYVSKVTTFANMFSGATVFTNGNNDAPINNWNIGGSVTGTISMFGMFNNADAFNRAISNWNMTKVTNTSSMFANTNVFNQSLSNWERSGSTMGNVTDMSGMFQSAIAFNGEVSSWDVSRVSSMFRMFYNATAFNQNIGAWNVSNVTNFADFMFGKTSDNFSSTNLDAIYNGWIVNGVQPNISSPLTTNISFGTIKYSQAGKTGKDTLLASPYNWRISDGLLTVSGTSNSGGLIRVTTNTNGFTTGTSVLVNVYGVLGTTNANGTWTALVISSTVIELQGSTYNAAWTSGGNVILG
jgi:surface protein